MIVLIKEINLDCSLERSTDREELNGEIINKLNNYIKRKKTNH